jgi:flagellar biosynthesis/type III secretory pathway protein FliH
MNQEDTQLKKCCQESYQKGYEDGKEEMQRQIEQLLKYTVLD